MQQKLQLTFTMKELRILFLTFLLIGTSLAILRCEKGYSIVQNSICLQIVAHPNPKKNSRFMVPWKDAKRDAKVTEEDFTSPKMNAFKELYFEVSIEIWQNIVVKLTFGSESMISKGKVGKFFTFLPHLIFMDFPS